MKTFALAALLALAACHRPQADQPTSAADDEARAKTAAKTIADLQAADDAARGPVPRIAPARPPETERPKAGPAPEATNDSDDDSEGSNAD